MDAEMDLKKGKMNIEGHWDWSKSSNYSLAALEKIRSEFDFAKESIKTSDHSSESNDESNGDEKRTGAKKKRMFSVPKRDQLIQTIYTGYDNPGTRLSLESGGA